MSKVFFPCPECSLKRSNKAGLKCFFCESGERISGLQRDLTARGQSFNAARQSHEVKRVHRHRHIMTHGKAKG